MKVEEHLLSCADTFTFSQMTQNDFRPAGQRREAIPSLRWGRLCGGIVDRQQRGRRKFRQVIWRNVNVSVHWYGLLMEAMADVLQIS